jgi:hypothetical protein
MRLCWTEKSVRQPMRARQQDVWLMYSSVGPWRASQADYPGRQIVHGRLVAFVCFWRGQGQGRGHGDR